MADHNEKSSEKSSEKSTDKPAGKPAVYWEALDRQVVRCTLCPHFCRIRPGKKGICNARANQDGQLIAESYGRITSLALDPIEKKPLFRFHSGSHILSAGSYGCNFRCGFCQNWTISQGIAPNRLIMPDELVARAADLRGQGNIGLAYTYNEPLVGFEYVLDCARLAHQENLVNVLVTNGSINPEPMEELLPWIDAMNIDLKAWRSEFYADICKGSLQPVLDTIVQCAARCHVEVTTLLIPGLNDQDKDVESIARWLASIRTDLPLHLTRHHPDYQMNSHQPIERDRLLHLVEIARESLKYVYPGNLPQ